MKKPSNFFGQYIFWNSGHSGTPTDRQNWAWKPPPEPRIIAHDRVERSKGQILWDKILTWKMLFGPISVQKSKIVGGIHLSFSSKSKQTQTFSVFLANIWPNTREHLPSQYLHSRDMAFNKVLIHIIISNYAIFTAATFLLAELSHAASLELKNSYLEIRCLVSSSTTGFTPHISGYFWGTILKWIRLMIMSESI